MIYAGVAIGSWILTIITFLLGYTNGKTSGYALGRSGGKDPDAE